MGVYVALQFRRIKASELTLITAEYEIFREIVSLENLIRNNDNELLLLCPRPVFTNWPNNCELFATLVSTTPITDVKCIGKYISFLVYWTHDCSLLEKRFKVCNIWSIVVKHAMLIKITNLGLIIT